MTTRRVRSRTEIYVLGQLRLYRDDLEQIAMAVAEAGTLLITCGAWEMTDPKDFADNAELPERLPDLVMTATRGASGAVMTVALGRTDARVELAEPDTLLEGVLNRIQRISAARIR